MTGPNQAKSEPPMPNPVNPSLEQPTPAPGKPADRRGRWVAILTGALSILIGLLYLVLITVLDARGPMQPPPPEALGLAAAPTASVGGPSPAGVQSQPGVQGPN